MWRLLPPQQATIACRGPRRGKRHLTASVSLYTNWRTAYRLLDPHGQRSRVVGLRQRASLPRNPSRCTQMHAPQVAFSSRKSHLARLPNGHCCSDSALRGATLPLGQDLEDRQDRQERADAILDLVKREIFACESRLDREANSGGTLQTCVSPPMQ